MKLTNFLSLKTLFLIVLAFTVSLTWATSADGQKRDSLTPEEDNLIREAESIDQRMIVFVKAIERRFLVLNNSSQSEKDAKKYGELPKGTRFLIIKDIEKILDEAINSIDDLATREKENKLLHKGLRILAEGSEKFLPLLESVKQKATEENEKISLETSIEYCQQIIGSIKKLPPPEKKDKN